MKPILKRIISQVTAVVMAAEFAGQNAQPFIAAHAESDSGGSKVSAVHSTDVNKGEEAAAASLASFRGIPRTCAWGFCAAWLA